MFVKRTCVLRRLTNSLSVQREFATLMCLQRTWTALQRIRLHLRQVYRYAVRGGLHTVSVPQTSADPRHESEAHREVVYRGLDTVLIPLREQVAAENQRPGRQRPQQPAGHTSLLNGQLSRLMQLQHA